ncbi:gas vesicle protein K [Thiocapsa rosea]|uniref:Gas vesicle protein GvpK n=1 Tax=Thiocapsa rosea TaxID=69360 RepID=A0A495V9P2_9GAMM|nr:gas vesicle protein K [Thiocapsa rosea]RKT46121.1 gas vesicle protein GvpK [Thiocapsa rosea]
MSDTRTGTAPSSAASAAPDTSTLQRANLLADLLETKVAAAGRRIDIDPERVQRGLGQLVLTVVKLLHVLLERQAIRRVDGGDLDEDEIEQLGLALMRQSEEIERLRRLLGLEEQDLNLDLGPLGKLF